MLQGYAIAMLKCLFCVCLSWYRGANVFSRGFVSSAPAIKGSGECGVLYSAEPVDACSKLTNKVKPAKNGSSSFVLIIRGGCGFEEKVRRAQEAGFKAAIVYDNENGGALVASKRPFLVKFIYA